MPILCVLKVREWAFPVEMPHARRHGQTSLLGMRWDWGNYGLLRPFFLSGPPLRRTRDVDGEEGVTKTTKTIPITALSSPRRKCGATGKGRWQCTALVPAAPVFWLAMSGKWSRIRAGGRKETSEWSLLQCALTHPVKPGSLACFRASWRARSVTSLTLHRR